MSYRVELDSDDMFENILRIHRDDDVQEYSDDIEPEDALFTRDLFWIIEELEAAYEQGLIDARNQITSEEV